MKKLFWFAAILIAIPFFASSYPCPRLALFSGYFLFAVPTFFLFAWAFRERPVNPKNFWFVILYALLGALLVGGIFVGMLAGQIDGTIERSRSESFWFAAECMMTSAVTFLVFVVYSLQKIAVHNRKRWSRYAYQ